MAVTAGPFGIHSVTMDLVTLALVTVCPGDAGPLVTACFGIRRHKENGMAIFGRLDWPEGQMPWFDLPLNQLREYRTETAEPPELDLWWQRRLEEARAVARPTTLTRYEADIYAPVEVYDTEFSGAGGDRIRAWYLRPAGADGQTPVVVKFIGYGGGRGMPAEHALLPALGYAVFDGARRTPAPPPAGLPALICRGTASGLGNVSLTPPAHRFAHQCEVFRFYWGRFALRGGLWGL